MDCVRCGGADRNCKLCKGSGQEKFYRCPVKRLTPDIIHFFRFYRFYKQGFLPVEGGLLDQSATFIQAVEIIDREIPTPKMEI